MTDTRSIAGVILAGGGGRRMFPASPVGGDKSFAELAGQPLNDDAGLEREADTMGARAQQQGKR